MKKDIRIVLVGEPGVGKSSLISTLLADAFQASVPAVVPEVRIPPESVRERVVTRLVDTDANDATSLGEAVRAADVVCVVYAADDDASFEAVSERWLPFITSNNADVPVVVVGNKIDVRGPDLANDHLASMMQPLMDTYPSIESCVECTAREVVNVAEVFVYAQKAVLHPISPIYDSQNACLRDECIKILTRLFHLSDTNKDGLLDDDELRRYQAICYGKQLTPDDLHVLKKSVEMNDPEGLEAGGLNLRGFLVLNTVVVQYGRPEFTWTALRHYGYDDNLELRDDFLHPAFHVSDEQTVELTEQGLGFFQDLFHVFDADGDGFLSMEDLDRLFATSPGIPWDEFPIMAETNAAGNISLNGWLAMWACTTLTDHRTTLEYLAFLGFEFPTVRALRSKAGKPVTHTKERATRTAFQALVFGSPPEKGDLVWASVTRGGAGGADSTAASVRRQRRFADLASACSQVRFENTDRYLVMTEVPAPSHGAGEDTIPATFQQLESCDVAVLCYYPGDFEYVARLYVALTHLSIPCVFVRIGAATDTEGADRLRQYCREVGTLAPVEAILDGHDLSNVFKVIVGVCMRPYTALPKREGHDGGEGSSSGFKLGYVLFPLALAALGGAGYWFWWRKKT